MMTRILLLAGFGAMGAGCASNPDFRPPFVQTQTVVLDQDTDPLGPLLSIFHGPAAQRALAWFVYHDLAEPDSRLSLAARQRRAQLSASGWSCANWEAEGSRAINPWQAFVTLSSPLYEPRGDCERGDRDPPKVTAEVERFIDVVGDYGLTDCAEPSMGIAVCEGALNFRKERYRVRRGIPTGVNRRDIGHPEFVPLTVDDYEYQSEDIRVTFSMRFSAENGLQTAVQWNELSRRVIPARDALEVQS